MPSKIIIEIMRLKRYIIFLFALFFAFYGLNAKKQNSMFVDSLSIERNENFLSIKFLLNLESVDVNSNRALLVTPCFLSETDTLNLVSFALYGRSRYLNIMRNGGEMLTGKEELSYRKKK